MFFWSDIEPVAPANGTPGYDWGKYDSLFFEYKNLGLEIIAVIGGLPSWAATNSYGPITSMNDLKRFISDLVERYDGDGNNDAPGYLVMFYGMTQEITLSHFLSIREGLSK